MQTPLVCWSWSRKPTLFVGDQRDRPRPTSLSRAFAREINTLAVCSFSSPSLRSFARPAAALAQRKYGYGIWAPRPKSHCFRLNRRRRREEGRLDESCEFSRTVAPGTGEKNGLSSHCYRAQGAQGAWAYPVLPLARLYTPFPLTTPPAAFGELVNGDRGSLYSVKP